MDLGTLLNICLEVRNRVETLSDLNENLRRLGKKLKIVEKVIKKEKRNDNQSPLDALEMLDGELKHILELTEKIRERKGVRGLVRNLWDADKLEKELQGSWMEIKEALNLLGYEKALYTDAETEQYHEEKKSLRGRISDGSGGDSAVEEARHLLEQETPEEIQQKSDLAEKEEDRKIQIDEDKLEESLDLISKGSLYHVVKGKYCGKLVALMKRNEGVEESMSQLRDDWRSVTRKWKDLEHEHILKLIGCYFTNRQLSLVTEMYEISLHDYLQRLNTPPNEADLIIIMKGILLGVEYLHRNHFLHCDLKPENVVMNASFGYVKLTGFALLRFRGVSNRIELDSTLGTPQYKAPETFDGFWYPDSDVYSFGMTMWQLVVNQLPWNEYFVRDGENYSKERLILLLESGKRPSIPNSCPEWQREMIEKCWNRRPTSRPRVSHLVRSVLDREQECIRRKSQQRRSSRLNPKSLITSRLSIRSKRASQLKSSIRNARAPSVEESGWIRRQDAETIFLAELLGWGEQWEPRVGDQLWENWAMGKNDVEQTGNLKKETTKTLVELLSCEEVFNRSRKHGKEVYHRLQRSNFIARLCQQVKSKNPSKVKVEELKLLALLDYVDESRQLPRKLLSESFLNTLYTILDNLGKSHKRRSWCCYLIGRIATVGSFGTVLDPSKVASVLFQQFTLARENQPFLTASILQALGTLLWHEPTLVSDMVFQDGLLEKLAITLETNKESIVQYSVFSIFVAFRSLSKKLLTDCSEARLFCFLVDVLSEKPKSVGVQVIGMKALANIAELAKEDTVLELCEEMMPVIQCAMLNYLENEEIQVAILSILKKIAFASELFCLLFEEHGIGKDLLQVIEAHPDHTQIQMNCFKLLLKLGFEKDKDLRATFVASAQRAHDKRHQTAEMKEITARVIQTFSQ